MPLLLALAACTGHHSDTSTDTQVADTHDTEVTDTQVTDTVPTTVPCDGLAFSGLVTVPEGVTLPAGAVTVGLFSVDVTNPEPAFGASLVSADSGAFAGTASLPFTLCVPTPAPADEWPVVEGDAVVGQQASYLAGAWVDTDGDGAFDAGEPLVGASFAMLAYVDATSLPDSVEALGGSLGWNLGTYDFVHETTLALSPLPTGTDAYELPANLCPVMHPSIAGTLAPAGDAATTIALLSLQTQLSDGPPPADFRYTSVVVDATAPNTAFTLSLPAPPADHFFNPHNPEHTEGNVEVAIYGGYAWADTNADGLVTQGETQYGASATNARRVVVGFQRPVDFTAVLSVQLFGNMGFVLGDVTATPVGLPWDDGLPLVAP